MKCGNCHRNSTSNSASRSHVDGSRQSPTSRSAPAARRRPRRPPYSAGETRLQRRVSQAHRRAQVSTAQSSAGSGSRSRTRQNTPAIKRHRGKAERFAASTAGRQAAAATRCAPCAHPAALQPLIGGTGAGRDQQRADHRTQAAARARLPPRRHKARRQHDHQLQHGNPRLGQLDVVGERGQDGSRAGERWLSEEVLMRALARRKIARPGTSPVVNVPIELAAKKKCELPHGEHARPRTESESRWRRAPS